MTDSSIRAVRVIARLIAKPDRVDELHDLLTGLLEPTRAEAGCVRYELHRNLEDLTDFTFVEEWASDGALGAHLESPHLQAARGRYAELCAVPPDVRRYEQVG